MFEKRNMDIISKNSFEKLITKFIDVNQINEQINGDIFNLKIKDARESFEKKFLMYNLKNLNIT